MKKISQKEVAKIVAAYIQGAIAQGRTLDEAVADFKTSRLLEPVAKLVS